MAGRKILRGGAVGKWLNSIPLAAYSTLLFKKKSGRFIRSLVESGERKGRFMSKSNKLYSSSILIAPYPIACQHRESAEAQACGAETYFSVPLPWITRAQCPQHLFPQLRKGQTERLWHWLGNALYAMSLEQGRQQLAGQTRPWTALTEEEQASLPLAPSLRSLIEQVADPQAHLEQVPLCDLAQLLAVANARAAVCAMGGEAWLKAQLAQNVGTGTGIEAGVPAGTSADKGGN